MMRPLLACLALSAAGAALAQDLPDRPIRRTEVIATVKRQFARLDANHDGVVTRSRVRGVSRAPAART